jgi:hypothetical protein
MLKSRAAGKRKFSGTIGRRLCRLLDKTETPAEALLRVYPKPMEMEQRSFSGSSALSP